LLFYRVRKWTISVCNQPARSIQSSSPQGIHQEIIFVPK